MWPSSLGMLFEPSSLGMLVLTQYISLLRVLGCETLVITFWATLAPYPISYFGLQMPKQEAFQMVQSMTKSTCPPCTVAPTSVRSKILVQSTLVFFATLDYTPTSF